MRRGAAIAVLVVLTAVLLVPVALLVTESGTRWLARAAQRLVPLQLDGLTGSLAGGISLEALTYRSEGLDVHAADLSVHANLRCLLRSALCIRSLTIAELTLRSRPTATPEPSRAPWELLADLPSVQVDEAFVGELRWFSGEREELLRELALSGALGSGALDLQRLAACHGQGCVDLHGGIDSRGRWRIAGELSMPEAPIGTDVLVLPLAYEVSADGDTRVARLQLSSREPEGSVSLAGELRYADVERASASLRLEGLGRLVPLLAEQAVYPLVGPLALELERRPGAALPVLDLRQDLRGPDSAVLPLAAHLVPDAQGFKVDDLTLGPVDTPRLRATGYLPYSSSEPSSIAVDLARWRIPPALGVAAADASGAVRVQLTFAGLTESWSATVTRLVLREDGRVWRADGALQASGTDPFPVGELELALRSADLGAERPLAFTYTRVDAGAPARLRSRGSIAAGNLHLAALSAAIAPGEPLEIEVVADGDISTLLRARLELRDGGARVGIDPFDVAYAGERFALRDGLAFTWLRESRAIELGPACIVWQGSELCTAGGPLEADGELALRIRVDETHSGALENKPYSIAARGQGEAFLAWRAWKPLSMRFDFAFDELLLDPFVGSATAQPVRWERATLSGRLDAAGDGYVDALLSSQQFGELSVAVTVLDERLEGRLRSSALSLVAFRDLVPGWKVEDGTIEGDLRLDGTLASPAIRGELALRDGRLRIPTLELQLDALGLDAQIDGRELTLQGQALAGGGDLRLEAQCCEEERLTGVLIGKRNRLQMENGLDATISPSLDFSLSAAQLTASGSLTVHAGVFEHSGLEEGGVAVSQDVRRLDVPEEPPERFALNLDLRTLIEPGFTLRSERIEATLAGDLRLLVPGNQPPSLFGNLEVLGGELRAYGQALRLTDGDLGFVGDPLNPDLAISAEREIRADNQRVGFRVSGTLEEPRFDLFSDPQRSDNETLSYLIRGRGPDVGVSADGTAMALSLGASALNQSGVLAPLNDLPGLSGISLGAEGTDQDMSATISAYVGNRLYLSYGVGIYEPINALTARLYLRSRLWLEVVSRLESSFDLYYRFDVN
jgi:hypothetical protein